jgi:hypothetical protein
MVGGSKASRLVKDAGRKQGHAEHTLKRAAAKLKIIYTSEGKPRTTVWTLPGNLQSEHSGDVS